ncbi:MAG: type II secretion system protein [SAR324 cluster bacterium]|nr:type II secretion system protein [SAR324 cluster bacterium]
MTVVRSKQKGFSLLEMGLVLFLFSILLGFSIPALPKIYESDLEQDAKRLGLIINKTRENALLQNNDFRIAFDQDEAAVAVEIRDPETYEFVLWENKSNPYPLSKGVRLRHFTNQPKTASKFGFEPIKFEKIFGQKYYLNIDASGFVDQVEFELADSSHFIGLKIKDILGTVSISRKRKI